MGDFDDEALGRVYGLRGLNGGKGQGRSTAHPESETRVLGVVVGEMGKYVEARGLVKSGLEPLFLDITRCILTAPKLDSMCIRVGHVIATLRDDSLSAEGKAALVELRNHCGTFPSEEEVAEFAQETRGRVKGRDKNREELGPFTVLEEQCMCPAFVVPMKGSVVDEVANTTLQMGDAVYSLMSGTPVRTAAAGVYLDYRPPLLGLPGCHGAAQLLLSLLTELVGCSFARYREVGSGQRVTIELFDTKFNIWRRRGASQPIQLLVRDLVLRGMYDQANIPIREGGAPVVVAKPDMSMDGVLMLRGVPRDKQLMMLSAGNAANKFMKRIQNISKHILPDLQKILDLILHLDPASDKNQAKILAEILDLHITFKPKAEGMVAPLFVAKNRVSKEVVLESFRSGFSDNDIPRIIEAFRRNNDIITEADIRAYYAPPAAAAAASQPATGSPPQPGSPPGAAAVAAAPASAAAASGTGTPQGKNKSKKN